MNSPYSLSAPFLGGAVCLAVLVAIAAFVLATTVVLLYCRGMIGLLRGGFFYATHARFPKAGRLGTRGFRAEGATPTNAGGGSSV